MFVPVKISNGRKFLTLMNNTILVLIKKKSSLTNRIKRNGSPTEYLRNTFKNLRSKVKRMLRESRLEHLNKICDYRDQNPKRFWSFFKSKAKYSNIPGKVSTKVNDNERKYADNTTDIANMFNHYFASIFTCDSYGSTDHEDRSYNVTTIDNITLSEEEIMAVIMNLNNNKAQGPDKIPVPILKEAAVQGTPSHCALFNKSLRVGVLPSDWKLANVVPIHKHGENGKSCITQLIEVLEQIGRELDRGRQIDVLYLDMSKAFDKVSPSKLFRSPSRIRFRREHPEMV